eukprot:1892203-Pyramimonas_sp.AAC.1
MDRNYWNVERLMLQSCCGPNSNIGNSRNIVDTSCRVMRFTESEDMRTNEGNNKSLTHIREFKGEHISLWVSIPCAG